MNVGLGVDTSLSKCAPGITLDDHCNAVGKAVVAASKSQKTAQVYENIMFFLGVKCSKSANVHVDCLSMSVIGIEIT